MLYFIAPHGQQWIWQKMNYNYILFFYVLIMILDESNFKLNGEVSLPVI